MPGYTHLQIAMPSSFGLWFGAYAESLVDDMLFLQAAFKMCNRNPLGSAAGYGSSFPLNRTMTTRLLGFDSLNYNVVYAQMGRGKMERNVAFALASIAGTVSKLAFDACMFNSQNFGFIKLPDQFTTGQILRLMEGSLAPVACLEAGSSPCDRAGECRTLSLWAGLNDVINKYLDQYTLADLLREDDGFDYVI